MSQENSAASNFEAASRIKLRFATGRGLVSVEDLWDMPLTGTFSLNDVAKDLHRLLKDAEETDFVKKATKVNEELQLGFDVVKHVIDVRVAEAEEAKNAAAKRAQKQKLLGLIAEKQDDALKGASIDELNAMVEECNG